MHYKVISSKSNPISIGTTGFRLNDPSTIHYKILRALKNFRESNQAWNIDDQKEFGTFLSKNEVWDMSSTDHQIVGGAGKNERLKTSFLKEIGLTTGQRQVTSVGEQLLNLDFSKRAKNKWLISDQSFIFLKQFLKLQKKDFKIHPLLSLIYCCLEFDNELPYEFLKNFWSSSHSKDELLTGIKHYKSGGNEKEYLLQRRRQSKQIKNIKDNLEIFLKKSSITDNKKFRDLIFSRYILPHRKGGTFLIDLCRIDRDKSYDFFFTLVEYWRNKNKWDEEKKKNFILEKLKSKQKMLKSSAPVLEFHEFLFNTTKITKHKSDWGKIISFFEDTDLMRSENKKDLLINFYLFFIYIADVVNIKEYEDLNFRHLKLLDIFYLDYSTVKLKLQFKYLFESVKDKLLDTKILSDGNYRNKLENYQEDFGEIHDFLKTPYSQIYERIINDIPEVEKMGLHNYEHKEKLKKLELLIEQSFTKEKLIYFFQLIDENKESEIKIRKKIKDEVNAPLTCSIPALFEYLLGIAFYWISDKAVKLENVLDGGLDANLLPTSHALGGRADVMGIKSESKDYIIEATLSDGDGQRKMEAEPVPRHLARYVLNNNKETIALFVARKLDYNNLVVLRNYRYSKWYDTSNKIVKSMDILPLTIKNILFILENNMSFDEFEKIAKNLIASKQTDGKVWYYEEVAKKFQ